MEKKYKKIAYNTELAKSLIDEEDIFLEEACTAIKIAGKELKNIINENNITVKRKDDNSPQTNGDTICEKIIKDHLLGCFPLHGFIGEEGSNSNPNSTYQWVCDPIDGTWSFINGELTWAISIALKKNNNIIVGVVYNPITNQLFATNINKQSTLNSNTIPLRLNKNAGTILNYQISATKEKDLLIINQLKKDNKIRKIVSTGGSPAYNLCRVATGVHSGFVVSGTAAYAEWDIAAGKIILEQAGGSIKLLNDGKVLIAGKDEETTNFLLKELDKSNFGSVYNKNIYFKDT